MTEYWVSRTKHWCEYCKVWIYDNKISISNHEMGLNHQKNVETRLSQMRKDSVAAERQKEQTARDMDRIEKAARRQYEKDLAAMRAAAPGGSSGLVEAEPPAPDPPSIPAMAPPSEPPPQIAGEAIASPAADEWTLDIATGYHFNAATGYHYDSNSGLYYSDLLGKWTTQEEAHTASKKAAEEAVSAEAVEGPTEDSGLPPPSGAPPTSTAPQISSPAVSTPAVKQAAQAKGVSGGRKGGGVGTAGVAPKLGGPAPGPVRSSASGPGKVGRGVTSLLDVAGKRKREAAEGPKTAAELAALEAREAAKKRQMERERKFLGLY